MQYKIASCSECDCNSKRPIVNKRHFLCKEKNHLRIYGESEYESAKRKSKDNSIGLSGIRRKANNGDKSIKPIYNSNTRLPTKSRIRSKSKKQTDIDKTYSGVINSIAQTKDKVCSGCGRWQGGEIRLSNSHIISRARCKQIGKPELITDENNITYHCMDFGMNKGCHGKHENPQQRHTLLDYEKSMIFVKENDPEGYKHWIMQENKLV